MSNNRTRPYPKLPTRTINIIGRYLFNGFSSEEISLLVNLPVSHVQALIHGKGDPNAKKASLILKDKAIERVKAGKGKINGLIFFLSRRFPQQFADPATQLTLSPGNTTNNTLIVSADVAEGLLKRSQSVLSDIDKIIADKSPALNED